MLSTAKLIAIREHCTEGHVPESRLISQPEGSSHKTRKVPQRPMRTQRAHDTAQATGKESKRGAMGFLKPVQSKSNAKAATAVVGAIHHPLFLPSFPPSLPPRPNETKA